MSTNATNGKEYKLLIRIAGAIDKSFDASLAASKSKLAKSVSKLDSNFTTLDKGFNKVTKVGKKCFGAIAKAAGIATIAVGAAVAESIKIGSSFESAFAGVKKTVDATDKEFARLRKDIIELSTEIPSTADEIAGVMEIAGQLGIANEGLTEFTKTMINLGVSTNMTAADAATALARFANITNMKDFGPDGVSNWERLGATIVDLGNNFATTEQEIVEMSYKLASTGDIVGLTEAEILALSTAMSSVGIKVEAGGSAMSKILKKMQLAVETNGNALAGFAAVSGMSAEEFSEAFRTKAVDALTAFISGLNNTERNGKSAVAVLDDLGMNEIRLSNMLLALANSSELVTEAVKTANQAWDEGSALAVEAGKRYETVESRSSIMLNTLKQTAISVYDGMREPLVNIISLITDKLSQLNEYVTGPNGINKWIKNIGDAIPAIQNKVKRYGKGILNFLNPLIDIGKWFLKNPKVIVSAIAGIGSALVTYKVASNLVHAFNAIVQFISAANPATWVILGLVAAVSGLMSAYTAYKISEQNLIDDNLVKHFGQIRLSMKDIQNISEYIVSSDSLGGVRDALKAFEDLEGISSTIDDSISELNKLNWKVSIGMRLTPDENESYKQAIADYVDNANQYAAQAQYAVSLNISLSGIADSTVSKVNSFYDRQRTELENLGYELNAAVTDAFNDGLLEIDEIDKIQNIEKQMADIRRALAVGEYDASLAMLRNKYTGIELNADTFQNLQDAILESSESAMSAFEDAYVKNYAALAAGRAGGAISDSEYNEAIKALDKNFADEQANILLRSLQFQINTIKDAYGGDIALYDKAVSDAISMYSGSEYNTQWLTSGGSLLTGTLPANIALNGSDESSRAAVDQLLEKMAGGISQLYKLAENNSLSSDTMTSVRQAIAELDKLQGFTYREAFWGYNGNLQGVTNDISNRVIGRALANSMYQYVTGNYGDIANHTALSTTAPLTGLPVLNGSMLDLSKISQHASGGLVSNTELSWLAERGPEMVVPLDGSSRAVSLWEQAGRLLGLRGRFDGMSLGSSGGGSVVYSPTLQFYGNAPSRQDLDDALRLSQDEFDAMMERYVRNNRRVSFA